MDCSLPGFSVRGILQARIVEWVAISSSRGSSQNRDRTHVSCSSCITVGFFTTEPLGKPITPDYLSSLYLCTIYQEYILCQDFLSLSILTLTQYTWSNSVYLSRCNLAIICLKNDFLTVDHHYGSCLFF